VLSLSVTAAQVIRSTGRAGELIAAAYRHLHLPVPGHDAAEPCSVTVVRLVEAAGEQRGELPDFLRQNAAPLFLNRMIEPDPVELLPPDPQAVRLQEYVQTERESFDMFALHPYFGPFSLAGRSIVA
jgi:hypothetical protein